MRICLLTLDFSPFRSSGLTIYAERLACGIAARGHNVTVIASQRSEDNRVEKVQLPNDLSVIRVSINHLDWLGFGWQASKYLQSRNDNFDIIHFVDVHFAYAYHRPFIASAFQSFRQRLTSHYGRPYHTNWRNYIFRLIYYKGAQWLMEQPSVDRARHIIMPSLSTQHEFIKHYNVPSSRTTLVYPGIDVHRFESLPDRDEARTRLSLPDDLPVLLYVGFSTPRKGVEYLAKALRIMKTAAHLIMVGKWETHYQKQFLDALGNARSRVHIAGYVPDAKLLVYFAAADVFVLPTLLEGFGYTLAEAMASGLPVVTTSGGSAGEIVGDGGLIVPAGDSAALASALDRVLTDDNLAHNLSRSGRARTHLLFTEDHMSSQIEAVYKRNYDCGRALPAL